MPRCLAAAGLKDTTMRASHPPRFAWTLPAFLLLGCGGDDSVSPEQEEGIRPTVLTAAITDITGSTAVGGGEVTSHGESVVTARGVVWSTMVGPTLERGDHRTTDGHGTGAFTSLLRRLPPGATHYVRAYATSSVGTAYGNQVQFTTRDGSNHLAVGFTMGARGYVGTGQEGSSGSSDDFWAYEPQARAWTQRADFGGRERSGAVGFSIGEKGYIGTGRYADHSGSSWLRDLWAYDPDTDTWTPKGDFEELERYDAVGFSIGDKGYIGTGTGPGPTPRYDFWEYDPATDTWSQRADFPGAARSLAVGFSIGDKGYVGTGYNGGDRRDFWEYDPETDVWTQKADFGGVGRRSAVGFSMGNKGYIGTGLREGFHGLSQLKDFWEYDPATDTWTPIADFAGLERSGAVGFSVGNRAFVGTGLHGVAESPVHLRDFWEYDPERETWARTADFMSGGDAHHPGGQEERGEVGVAASGARPSSQAWMNRSTSGQVRVLPLPVRVRLVLRGADTVPEPLQVHQGGFHWKAVRKCPRRRRTMAASTARHAPGTSGPKGNRTSSSSPVHITTTSITRRRSPGGLQAGPVRR